MFVGDDVTVFIEYDAGTQTVGANFPLVTVPAKEISEKWLKEIVLKTVEWVETLDDDFFGTDVDDGRPRAFDRSDDGVPAGKFRFGGSVLAECRKSGQEKGEATKKAEPCRPAWRD